jgi:hypothetical protein
LLVIGFVLCLKRTLVENSPINSSTIINEGVQVTGLVCRLALLGPSCIGSAWEVILGLFQQITANGAQAERDPKVQ